MGRSKRIWRRKRVGASKGHWYTTDGQGRKVKVADKSKTYKEAFDQFTKLHLAPGETKATVKRVADEFLEWCQTNKAERTYEWYQSLLKPWCATLDDNLLVEDARVHHVQKWLDGTDWNDNTKSGAVRAVLRCFNWGVKQGHCFANPFTGIERPTRTPRELAIDDEQFAKLLTLTDAEFGDYLTFLYETGSRVQEGKLVTAAHWDGQKLILERKNSKGKLHRRVIYANPKVAAIINRLAAKHPVGPLFRNAEGKPFSPAIVQDRFRRFGPLRKGKRKVYGLSIKMGIPGLCATTLRHSFCTNALKRGVDTTTVALLMGHRDATMVARVYQHLAKDHDYLAKAAERATGGGIPPVVVAMPAVVDMPPVAQG